MTDSYNSAAAGEALDAGAGAVGDTGAASPSPAANYSNGNGVSHAKLGDGVCQGIPGSEVYHGKLSNGHDEYASAPQSWSREYHQEWSAIPARARQYIMQRESEAHRQITSHGERLKQYEPYDQLAKEHADHFTKYGRQPHETFAELMRAHQYLDTNPQAFLSEVAQRYGVDVAQLLPQGYPKLDQIEALAQAQTAWQQHAETLAAEVQQLKTQLAEREASWKASEKKREVEAEKRAEDARKAARVNVRSTPGAQHNPQSMEQTIEAIAGRIYR